MKASDLVKNAPNSVVYSVAAIFVTIIIAFVVLAVTGSSSDDFRSFLNTVLQIGSVVLSGGAVVAAGAAAKSSANAERSSANTEDQTNGQLDQKIETAVRRAIYAPDGGNLPTGK